MLESKRELTTKVEGKSTEMEEGGDIPSFRCDLRPATLDREPPQQPRAIMGRAIWAANLEESNEFQDSGPKLGRNQVKLESLNGLKFNEVGPSIKMRWAEFSIGWEKQQSGPQLQWQWAEEELSEELRWALRSPIVRSPKYNLKSALLYDVVLSEEEFGGLVSGLSREHEPNAI
ncbi:unnamed protein product [Linum trigynum]|uniref:Uncharacterized protein n=1 Tax=Linum trigynum TaxID=586398 RepID=A0AAV2FYI7_9ROSI